MNKNSIKIQLTGGNTWARRYLIFCWFRKKLFNETESTKSERVKKQWDLIHITTRKARSGNRINMYMPE